MEKAIQSDAIHPMHTEPMETVRAVARLSMLTLPAEQEARMAREFPAMVQFADALTSLTAEAPRKAASEQAKPAPLRPDLAMPSLAVEEVLMNAATVNGAMITVPKTFE
ncbi:MAG: Asp-tRNA(Asn)/Glu-tRNA(Gln) amidotransferase subunit GatC [Clostridia bacterium]